MSNFKQDIEQAVAETTNDIEKMKIVIGDFGTWSADPRDIPAEKKGQLMTWAEAAPLLDYEYYTGYGGEDCHAITGWTKDWIFLVGHYDGSTWIEKVPRNPVAHQPTMVGGG